MPVLLGCGMIGKVPMEEINEKLHRRLIGFRQSQRDEWVEARKPFSVLFELTPHCNMNCIHCYLQHMHGQHELSFQEIAAILDILYEKGILFLVLTGGEILTWKDFLDIYLYAKRKGFLIEPFSNGLAFTDEIIDVLKRYPPLYIDITLYGSCEETYAQVTRVKGAFQKVVDNCRKLKDAHINLSLRSPIMEEAESEMHAMKEVASSIGAPFVCSFEMILTINRDTAPQNHQVKLSTGLKYESDNYYDQVKRGSRKDEPVDQKLIQGMTHDHVFSCNVGLNGFVIDYRGYMCPCMKLKHRGVPLLGNDFDAIWKSFAEDGEMQASNSYKCRSCKARYFCDVCPAEMDLMFGDNEYRPEEACHPAQVQCALYQKELPYEEALAMADRL